MVNLEFVEIIKISWEVTFGFKTQIIMKTTELFVTVYAMQHFGASCFVVFSPIASPTAKQLLLSLFILLKQIMLIRPKYLPPRQVLPLKIDDLSRFGSDKKRSNIFDMVSCSKCSKCLSSIILYRKPTLTS